MTETTPSPLGNVITIDDERSDALIRPVGPGERFPEAPFKPAPRVLPFSEDDQPTVVPILPG